MKLVSELDFVLCIIIFFCLSYSSTLKMKGVCSSETLLYFQRTSLLYTSEKRTLRLVEHREVSDKHIVSKYSF
jgi:hypothetical protein